ncbi:MBL fold metallo-hydrolase [Clostridium sp. DL1XJH146]
MLFCPLYSGSSGNSIFVSSKESSVLIDAGLPGKRIEEALKQIDKDPSKVDAIFVTHEHSDHIKGVGVLSRKYDIPIYANESTWREIYSKIGKIKENNIMIMDKASVEIKDMLVSKYNISHDAVEPVGYCIESEHKKACVATDLGYFSEEVRDAITDSDIILLESNHDIEMLKVGPYPYHLKRRILSSVGHLSNEDCGKAIVDIINSNCNKIFLGHLSRTNNYPDLAYQTVINVLRENNIKLDKDVFIELANRDKPSTCIEL